MEAMLSMEALCRAFCCILFAMPLSLYNTFSKKETELHTIEPKTVRMYTCGPTVYGRPHIGNYSSFLMADLLRRWLEVSGYTVKHVKNITDVGHLLHDADHGDDKIQTQAEKEKIHPLDIAKRYTDQYLDDEKALNMLEPMARPRASAFIKEQLKIIKTLLKKGNAYETDDGIYFAVETFPQYGALSGNTLQNLNAGARVEVDERKKHPADFALWKKCIGDNGRHVLRWSYATGEVSHSSGEDASSGFPGWHIECSAMSQSLLGDQIDLHTGGEDNIFPHHECEIAQSEAATGKQFVRLWLHKRRIDLGDAKMSKSLGNILTIPDIVAKGYSPLDLRYYLLSVHYRTNLKFSQKGLEDAKNVRRKIGQWILEVEHVTPVSNSIHSSIITEYVRRFSQAMNEDLNVSAALAVVFEIMAYSRVKNVFAECKKFAEILQNTFGCFTLIESVVDPEALALAQERDDARARKDFAESDRLRDQLMQMGYEVRDSKEGTQVKRK